MKHLSPSRLKRRALQRAEIAKINAELRAEGSLMECVCYFPGTRRHPEPRILYSVGLFDLKAEAAR